MRPRSFRVRPSDDDEFLAVERLSFAPEAAVTRRVRRVDRLRDDALETELAKDFEREAGMFCAVRWDETICT